MTDNASKPEYSEQRVTELETRITYLEDTVDTQNREIAQMASDLRVMKEALQMMYKKVSEFGDYGGGGGSAADEPPPPHY